MGRRVLASGGYRGAAAPGQGSASRGARWKVGRGGFSPRAGASTSGQLGAQVDGGGRGARVVVVHHGQQVHLIAVHPAQRQSLHLVHVPLDLRDRRDGDDLLTVHQRERGGDDRAVVHGVGAVLGRGAQQHAAVGQRDRV